MVRVGVVGRMVVAGAVGALMVGSRVVGRRGEEEEEGGEGGEGGVEGVRRREVRRRVREGQRRLELVKRKGRRAAAVR